MVNRAQAAEARKAMVEQSKAAERAAPGVGKLTVPEQKLLEILGFAGNADIQITGLSWSEKALHIDLVGQAIHWQGGDIVSTDPVTTDTQAAGLAET